MSDLYSRKFERELRFAVERCLLKARVLIQAPDSVSGSDFPLVVGVSGGEDSHALLHVLLALRSRLSLRLVVAHIDHGLRPESRDEAKFVGDLSKSYGLEFRLLEAAPRGQGENVEAWGRKVRYSFFEEVRKSSGAWISLTAHHRHDQAETVLFRVLSGRALTSARAISEIDIRQRLVRPLLSVGKASIREYVKQNGLQYVVDSSNHDIRRTRNKIRQELLPLIEAQYNPNVVEDLCLFAERFGADEELLWQIARQKASGMANPLPLSELRQVSSSLRWRILAFRAESVFGEDGLRIGYGALQEVVGRVMEESLDGPKTIELGFGYIAKIHPSKGVEFGFCD